MGGLSSTRDTISFDFPRKNRLHWGWLSSGITCMAMFAAFPSTIMGKGKGKGKEKEKGKGKGKEKGKGSPTTLG